MENCVGAARLHEALHDVEAAELNRPPQALPADQLGAAGDTQQVLRDFHVPLAESKQQAVRLGVRGAEQQLSATGCCEEAHNL